MTVVAFYGKLPGTGDFLYHRVPKSVLRPLEDWLAKGMTAARESLGDGWADVFDAAPPWRFWIGDSLAGQTVTGVMIPSRDRVGRRFPALGFWASEVAGLAPGPPVLDADPESYGRMEAGLYGLQGVPQGEVQGALEAFAPEIPGRAPPELPREGFWAVGAPGSGEDGLNALLNDAGPAELLHAAATRSYWWTVGDRTQAPALHAAQGFPDPVIFAWFLRGVGEHSFAMANETI
ncbi:MAG: type VI secretion system-associated protein TagF [Pseudomonadota bacterium]